MEENRCWYYEMIFVKQMCISGPKMFDFIYNKFKKTVEKGKKN